MRTTVVPAQVTTLEDKIIGNLSFIQICFLMVPVIWTMVVFILLPPSMHFVWYKIPVIGVVSLIALVLAIRIKDKLVFDWLLILIRFHARPTYYVFTKDTYLRHLDLPIVETAQKRVAPVVEPTVVTETVVSVSELVQLDKFLRRRKYRLAFVPNQKGDLHVSLH